MDLTRSDIARGKKRQGIIYSVLAVVLLAGVTFGLSQLEPAAPGVDRRAIWTDTVKPGEMLRQDRGNGTLVPEQTKFVQSETDGRVERILVKPGAQVTGETLLPVLTAKQSRAKAADLNDRVSIEEERSEIAADSAKAQIAAAEAALEKTRAPMELKKRRLAALEIRAGIDGVLQQIGDTVTLQVDQSNSPSATLARIVQPTKLKAGIKIAETQARDLLIGEVAAIDTDNGIIPRRAVHTLKPKECATLNKKHVGFGFMELSSEGTTIIQTTPSEANAAYGNRIIRLRDA